MFKIKFIIIGMLLISPLSMLMAEEVANTHIIKVGESVTIKRIPNDEQALNEIVAYSVLAQTLFVATAQTLTTINLFSKINFVQYLRIAFSFLISKRARKKDFCGLVYDVSNSKPIPFAVIRAVNHKNQELLKTTVSDMEGRYGFLLEPGQYELTIEHQDYLFPVDDKNVGALQNDNQSYFGGVIELKNSAAVNFNIPMKPRTYRERFSFNKLRNIITNSGLAKLTQNLYFIYTLFLLNLLLLVDEFSWLMLFLTIYYGIFVLFHLYANINKLPRTWGSVIDSVDGKPIPNVFLKFFSKKDGALIDSKITDKEGRFQLFIEDGDYTLIAQAMGYSFPANELKKSLNTSDLRVQSFRVLHKSVNLMVLMDPISNQQNAAVMGKEKFTYTKQVLS